MSEGEEWAKHAQNEMSERQRNLMAVLRVAPDGLRQVSDASAVAP